jgi:hypothetical protein
VKAIQRDMNDFRLKYCMIAGERERLCYRVINLEHENALLRG